MHNLIDRLVLKLPFLFYWLPPIVWMAVIFWFSTDRFASGETESRFDLFIQSAAPWLERADRVRLHIVIRKLGHLTEYALLAVLWMRAFESRRWKGILARQLPRVVLVALLVLGCALFDEWRQTFTASRSGTLTDSLIDFGGGVLGLIMRRVVVDWTASRGRRLTRSASSDNV